MTTQGPCAKQVVTCTLVHPDGRRWVGRNDVQNPQKSCPRGALPSGVGYELCHNICEQMGHAEEQALRAAGADAKGCTAYIEGIHYICMNCQVALTCAGVHTMTLGVPPADSTAGNNDWEMLMITGQSSGDLHRWGLVLASASIDNDPEFQRLAEYWRGEPYGTRSFENAWVELVAYIDSRATLAPVAAQPYGSDIFISMLGSSNCTGAIEMWCGHCGAMSEHWRTDEQGKAANYPATSNTMTVPVAAQQAAAVAAPTLMRQAVASVVSRVGDDFRIGWLRPERVEVGTLLYCATEPDAAATTSEDALDGVRYREWRDRTLQMDNEFIVSIFANLLPESLSNAIPTAEQFDAAFDSAMRATQQEGGK